jgi:hypothetical protein
MRVDIQISKLREGKLQVRLTLLAVHKVDAIGDNIHKVDIRFVR